jgi:hypothetical protein
MKLIKQSPRKSLNFKPKFLTYYAFVSCVILHFKFFFLKYFLNYKINFFMFFQWFYCIIIFLIKKHYLASYYQTTINTFEDLSMTAISDQIFGCEDSNCEA